MRNVLQAQVSDHSHGVLPGEVLEEKPHGGALRTCSLTPLPFILLRVDERQLCVLRLFPCPPAITALPLES